MSWPPTPLGPFTHLSDSDRLRNLEETLRQQPEADELWVFAYGSLMWKPCFTVAEHHPALLRGYTRAFSIFTVESRGTPARPGLGLALQPGDSCRGMALRIAAEARGQGLRELWAREMLTGIYSPLWVRVSTQQRELTAVTFVVNADHEQYAGNMPRQEQARLIQAAHGKAGSCRDYLAGTVAALRDMGIEDAQLSALLELVDA